MKRINWAIKDKEDATKTALNRYRRFLEQKGRRPSTIDSYLFHVEKYLKFSGTDRPFDKNLQDYRRHIFDQHWARSTLNNSAFAVTAYHEMLGETVKIPILTRNETLPYYFSEDEVARFFVAIRNLKHLCIFQVLFCACLRASELCGIDDADLDLDRLTIRYERERTRRLCLLNR